MIRSLSTPTRWRSIAVLLSAAYLLAACSDDGAPDIVDDPPAADDAEDAAASDEPEPAETPDQATATIEPPLDLAGTRWFPGQFSYQPGDTGITNPLDDEAYFELRADGTLVGFTGCNEFEGTWEITGPYYDYDDAAEAFDDKLDGQPISITAAHSTEVECEGFLADDDVNLLGALVATEIWWIGNDFGDAEGGITLRGEGAQVWADPA